MTLLFALFLTYTVTTGTGAAHAADAGNTVDPYKPAMLLTNTGGNEKNELIKYTVTDGKVTEDSRISLAKGYSDIAISANGTKLYAIGKSPEHNNDLRVWVLDTDTGEELEEKPVAGLPTDYFPNALTPLQDGDLLTGTSGDSKVVISELYRINPETGQATKFEMSLSEGYGSAGDFLTVSDHEIMAIATHKDQYDSPLESRLSEALLLDLETKSVRSLGEVPISYGRRTGQQ